MCKYVTNIEKEKILMHQFISKTQIMRLMDSTNSKAARNVFDECRRQADAEGKTLFHTDKVLKSRVVKLLGINEKEIHRYAELERQNEKRHQLKCDN